MVDLILIGLCFLLCGAMGWVLSIVIRDRKYQREIGVFNFLVMMYVILILISGGFGGVIVVDKYCTPIFHAGHSGDSFE